jgi:hypothetical protein
MEMWGNIDFVHLRYSTRGQPCKSKIASLDPLQTYVVVHIMHLQDQGTVSLISSRLIMRQRKSVVVAKISIYVIADLAVDRRAVTKEAPFLGLLK